MQPQFPLFFPVPSLGIVPVLVRVHNRAELLLSSPVKGKLIDPVSILVVGEKMAGLQFSIPVERFFGVARRPDGLAANGVSWVCVLRDAFGHVPCPVAKKGES